MTTLTRRQAAKCGAGDEYDSDLEAEFATYLRMYGVPAPEEHYVFHAGRKWAGDFCWLAEQVMVEVDGETAHVHWEQATKDAEKRNIAQLDGWTVLVFTGQMIRKDPAGCVAKVMEALGHAQEQRTH